MTNASRFALVATLLLSAGAARAAAPLTFTYSGYLTDAAGAPATASTTLDFQFFDLGTGGTLLGHEYNVGVTPNADGYFSVILGAGYVGDTPATLTFEKLFGFPTFMAVKYGTTEPYMTQRVPLTSVPSAMSVAWSGVTGFPAPCGPGTVLTGFDTGSGGALCVADADTGTITGVTAGTGLTGGGTAGTVTLSVSPTAVQTRVGGSCAAGNSIRVINQDGTVTCQADTNSGGTVTSVGATTNAGIAIGGTATAPTVGLTACATAGYVMKWNGTSWACAADVDTNSGGTITGVTAGTGLTGGGTTGSVTLSLNSAASPTFAGLTVTGNLSLGWELVTATGAYGTNWGVCNNYGGVTCYGGGATATCPVGKRVVGGGCHAGNAFRSTLSETHPNASGDAWVCYGSSDYNTLSITAYALCARLAP